MFAPIETQQGDTFVEFVLDDITEYKNKVVHFENLDEIYKFTFQTSKIPQIRWDQDGNFVMANKSFYDLFYLPENYFDGKEINIFNTDLKNIMVFNDITFFDAEGYVYSKHSKQSIPAGLKKYYSKVMNAESVNVLVNFDITPLLKKYRIALSPENVDNAQHLWLRHFVHPVITNHGQLSSVLFEFYDIHKYIELQNKYNISNSYLQAIANNFYSGIIFIVDINNKIVFFGGEEEVKVRLQIFTTNYTQLMMDLTTLPQISNLRDNVFAALNGNYSRIVAEIFDNTYDFQFFPIRNKDGKIEFCMGIGFNITERENYENQLVFQKNFLDRTFTESPIPTIIIDKSGKINRANIRYFQLVGITPDRYDELDVYNEDSWLNKEIIVSSFKNSLKGQSIQFEVSEERTFMLIDDDDVDADEYIFTLNCRSYPIFNNQNVVENVVMNFIDVSDTKALIDGMTKSNAINNIVTSNYPDGILMILDKNFKFILFEGKEEIELIKMNKIRVVGNNLNTFESVITDKIKPYILEVVENKQKINFDFSIEITAELTFPITAYYEVSVIPILDIQKDIEYIYLCLKNITNRKQLEQTILEFNSKLEAEVTQRTAQLKETTYDLEVYVAELQSTQDKLLKAQNELSENLDKEVELNQMKSQFISLMSHEFRTPLTIIQTYIYLMETYYEVQMKDKFDGSVQKVLGSIELMTKLLDNILFLDDVKEHIVVFLQFDIVGFVKTLIDSSVESLKAEQNIILNSDKEIYMFSDDKLLTNIVTNLLSNAIKYSPKTADIIIDIINDTKTLTFSVQDFGNGISDDVVDKIFDSFVRSSDFTNISGSGLGLSLVKSCVNLLKGKVSFETEKAKGSKFIVTLPKFTEEEVHKIMESQSKDSE
jgi:signal transduction histidine kinase/PAS domain-containing protein